MRGLAEILGLGSGKAGGSAEGAQQDGEELRENVSELLVCLKPSPENCGRPSWILGGRAEQNDKYPDTRAGLMHFPVCFVMQNAWEFQERRGNCIE